jgi:hypothetical protein
MLPVEKMLVPVKKINGVFYFLNIFYFVIFCRMHYFEFLNSVLIKTLEMDSSFFRIFYFKKFKNFQFDRSIFQKLMKLVPSISLVFMKIDQFLSDFSIHGWRLPPSAPAEFRPFAGRFISHVSCQSTSLRPAQPNDFRGFLDL